MRKRFIITIVLFGTFVFAHGQQTVIPFGQRLPYLYYWDSNWYDSVILKYPLCSSGDYDFIYSSTLPRYMQGDKFIGRVCITDYPLRVIGIAAAAKIVFWNESTFPYVVDTSVANRLPEYFRLYQMGGASYTDYTLLKEVRWDTVTPQYQMAIPCYYPYNVELYYDTVFDLYEVYFDKPCMVYDTFCVGGTTHNNLMHGYDAELFPVPVDGYFWSDHPITWYPCIEKVNPNCTHYLPNPPFHISWYYHPYSASNVSSLGPQYCETYDTTPFQRVYPYTYAGWNPVVMAESWLPFFVIFDPSCAFYDTACLAPTGFHIESMTMSGVTMAWDAGMNSYWQVSVAPVEAENEDDTILETPINYRQVTGLDTGQWYVARVRTICNEKEGLFGPWSDTVMFCYQPVPDDTCGIPTWLHVTELDSAMVTLAWNAEDATAWEVEMGLDEMGMSNSQLMATTTNSVTVEALSISNAWYWARVRALCDTDLWSDWTDTIHFWVPSQHPGGPDTNGNDTTKIVNPVEQYTYLMPNPAREEVTVMSSFKVRSVELYAADGKLLKEQQEVNAIGTRLSLEGLPAGVYFIRVRTSAGVTTKRLVVESH